MWSKGLIALNLTAGDAGDPIAWEFISKDAYGGQSVGKCEAGNSTGAAKHCYFQLNNAAYGNGTFFLNAFQEPTSPESVVATDATAGRVLFEHSPSTSNVIDMAWTKWTPAGAAQALNEELRRNNMRVSVRERVRGLRSYGLRSGPRSGRRA